MQLITISTMNWPTFAELAFGFSLTFGIAGKSLAFALFMACPADCCRRCGRPSVLLGKSCPTYRNGYFYLKLHPSRRLDI